MKEPMVILDDGAKEVGLADMVFNLIRQNLEQKPHKLKSFYSLHINGVLIARDIDITITLAFKRGELTIYNGIVGKPDLKIIADHDTILELSLINFIKGIPNYFDRMGRTILKKLLFRNIQVKGMLSRPLQLIYLTKIFSVN